MCCSGSCSRVHRHRLASTRPDESSEDGAGPTAGKDARADNAPLDNKGDHMVSAISGNGEVVARAVTARNLVQVSEKAFARGLS